MREQVLFVVAALAAVAQAAALKPVGVERFFVTPGRAALLRWRADAARPAEPLDYVVRSYWGAEAGKGRAKIGADGAVEVEVAVGRGFFDIEFPAAKQRFGIISLPAFDGKADPFFAIDGALSWLVRDDAVREGLIKSLRRSGVAMQRERLSWAQINPAEGKWDWQAPRRYETVRLLHKKHGVEMLEMFHDSPRWPGRLRDKYPADLAKTAQSWQAIARRWAPLWGAFEVWNEPDISFGAHLPGDQYAALVKTIAYAFHQGKAKVPLVGGVFAHYHRGFLEACARNGMLECLDVVSFHTYGRAPQMEALVGRYREWLRRHGKEAMPLWITECGRPWKRGPERPPADQDAASALDITMKGVEARACGIARYFPFVYPYYEERGNNFGMMGKRATPLRSMAAYAQMVAALAHKRYLGDLRCDDRAIQRARVFGDGRETVAVLYTARPDGKATVKLGIPALRVEGIDGRPLAVEAGRVPVPDGMSYVWFDRARLGNRLVADTPAMKLWRMGQQKHPKRPEPSPIVLRLQLDPEAMKAETKGYRVLPAKQGRVPLTIRLFNLADQPKELIPRIRLSPAGEILAGPSPVRVQAAGHADVSWQLDLRKAFEAAEAARVTISTVEGDRASAPPLVLDLFSEVTMEQLKRRHGDRIPLVVTDLSRWQRSAPAYAKTTMTVTPEKHWRLDVTFGEGDPWVYPSFALPRGMDLSRAKALAIRARCQRPAIVRVFLWEGGGVGYLTPDSIIPADGKWHTALVPFTSLRLSSANRPDPNGRLDLKQVRRIAIGMNSKARQNTLEVSEVFIISKE